MDRKAHWDTIYKTKGPQAVSWYREHLETSLALIEGAAASRSAAVIDVGAGASTLVDDLLARGFRDVTVLDISQAAIEAAQRRLGPAADQVHWIAGDVLEMRLPAGKFEIWHDRAVFHFLTSKEQRAIYLGQVARTVKRGGHIIVSTFGPEGPTKCSGLEVMRYDADSLHRQFGQRFRLVKSSQELHETPFGTRQQFVYCYCRIE
jgi:ubiquinone/menaquinone biosynthesis C-methylase UbiE